MMFTPSPTPILVTGAAGFIGFHVAKSLIESGQSVVGVDNLNDYYDVNLKRARLAILKSSPLFSFAEANIADKTAMENLWAQHSFTRVIHLAAQAGVRYSLENPYAYIESNCLGHLTILEQCRHAKNFEHLIYASSSSVYGANDMVPFRTTDRTDHPVSLYAATKKSCEMISQSYAHLYGVPQTGLRFFTVYGPWGRPDMAYFSFTKAILEDKPIPLFNNGDMKRDFTYIDDIVAGLVPLLDQPPAGTKNAGAKSPHRILNIGNTKSENLMDFVKVLEQALGKPAVLDMRPMQMGDVHQTYSDVSDLTALTGFKPTTSIQDGIPKFVEWYRGFYK
jgi:UDP-glucuronate 4-epimerase